MTKHVSPDDAREHIEIIEIGSLDNVFEEFPVEESLLLRGPYPPRESHRTEDEFPSESSSIGAETSEEPVQKRQPAVAPAPVRIGVAHLLGPALAAVAALAVVAITSALGLDSFVRWRPQDERPSVAGASDVVLISEGTTGHSAPPVERLTPAVEAQTSSIERPTEIREKNAPTSPPVPPRVAEPPAATGRTALPDPAPLASREVLASNTRSPPAEVPVRTAAEVPVASPVGTAGAPTAPEPRPAVERPADSIVVATARAPVAAVVTPTGEVQRALTRYQNAFSQLDVAAVRQVWPTVNGKAVAKAFDQLRQENLTFESCAITVSGQTAVAACVGTTSYVPKVGNKSARVERQQWLISLRQVIGAWVIDTVEVGPG